MKLSFAGPLILIAGALAGVSSAVIAARAVGMARGVESGVWQYRDVSADSIVQPYAMASYVLDGRLPPSPGQLSEFTAETDSQGGRLTSACVYRLKSGTTPLPRWWSLMATGRQQRYHVITSQTAVALKSGEVVISVSPAPQDGNWLQAPEGTNFTLVYSGSIESGSSGLQPSAPFTVTRHGC